MADPPVVSISPPDVQAQLPSVEVSLSRVGVTGVEKVIRILQNGSERAFHARIECFVDLGPRQKGAHMSRSGEVINDAIGEGILGEATFRAETLAQHVAELVRARQDARRAEVTIAARFPEHKPAPVSGITTQEMYTLFGSAVASDRGTRRLIGVAAQGMTACPCAQGLVEETAGWSGASSPPSRTWQMQHSSRPARRTSRRSTSTTWWPSASGLSARCATRSPPASTRRTTPRCAPGWTARASEG